MYNNISTATPKIEFRNDTKYYEAQESVCDAVSYIKQNSLRCINNNNKSIYIATYFLNIHSLRGA